ncbi:MAG: hypothetical protein H6845_01525 [Alphaproteobacteria bacterium]|nr:MAG: hypothetical protein H6845_01525 [Alphaproteobacteria bacterium]
MFINNFNLGQRQLLLSGSNKKIYSASKDSIVLHYHTNHHNIWRNHICSMLWQYLSNMGIKNHFIQKLSVREQLVKAAETHPIFATVHNISTKEMQDKFEIDEGTQFATPLIEWRFKNKDLEHPTVSTDHILHFGWITQRQMDEIKKLIFRTNDVLKAYFYCYNMRLGSLNLEFGSIKDEILLIDEISPETCEFWDHSITFTLTRDAVYENLKSMFRTEKKPE